MAAPAHPSQREAFRFWLKLGFINFGGPTGQIALMHTELVERRRWISDQRFLHALNYCMILPGPEAQQLATYIGWLLHGTPGGLVSGILFVLPGFFIMLGLAWVFAAHGDVTWVAGLFAGLAAAVVGIVAVAALRLRKKTAHTPFLLTVSIVSFVAILARVPFPLVVIGAGVLGFVAQTRWPRALGGAEGAGEAPAADPAEADRAIIHDDAETPAHGHATLRRSIVVTVVGLAAWALPLLMIAGMGLGTPVYGDVAWLFSKAAMVTFGGAYAVLAYINQAAVLRYGWLTSGQMASGLGLAETTPGPLILVTVFVGYLAGFGDPGVLSPGWGGVLGGTVALWATFAPCFLWIFLGAPWIERLRGNDRLAGALATVTAAVLGVIVSLAATLAVTTLFTEVSARSFGTLAIPVWQSLDVFALALAVAAFIALRWAKVSVVQVILVAGLAGILRALF